MNIRKDAHVKKKQTSSPPPSSIQHHYHLCASVCASFWPASINRINKMQTQTQTYIHLKITQLHRCTWYFLHDLGHMVTMKRLKWKWGKSCNIYCHTNHKTKIKRMLICRGNTHTHTPTLRCKCITILSKADISSWNPTDSLPIFSYHW